MKNIFVKFSALFVFVSLAACGKSLTVTAGGGGGPNNSNQRPPVAVGDAPVSKACTGAPPQTATLTGTTWYLTQAGGNLKQITGLVLDNNVQNPSITLTVTCMVTNSTTSQPLMATVTSVGINDGKTLQHSATQTKTTTDPTNNRRTCSSYLDGNPSPYKLVGNCLLININGQNHYFTHSGRIYYY